MAKAAIVSARARLPGICRRARALLLLTAAGGLRAVTLPAQQPAKTAGDVLIFVNGDQLTGKLERVVSGSVVFKSDLAGEVTVSVEKVKELRSSSPFVALRKNEKNRPLPAAGAVELSAGNVTLTRPDGTTETLGARELGFLMDRETYDGESRPKGIFRGWSGTLSGGASLVRSTQTATTLSGSATLARAVPQIPYLPARNRTVIDLSEAYGKQTSPVLPPTLPSTSITVKSSIFHADFERDEYFTPRFYALADAAFDHNYAQGLQVRQVYGAGAGYSAIRGARQQLDLKADVHYERQTYFAVGSGAAVKRSAEIFGSTFAETYTRNLPRKVVFTEFANYLAAWNALSDYSANVSGTLAMPVWKRMSASVTATDNYLNEPPPFFHKNSFQFITGITYVLR